MGRVYTASDSATVSTAVDVFEVVAPSDAAVAILNFAIGQTSDYGDSEAEGTHVRFMRGHTSSGSGGSVVSPIPMSTGDVAFGGSCEAANTTLASGGVAFTVAMLPWNLAIMAEYFPEKPIILSPGQRMVMRIESAPADAIDIVATVMLEEIGG